MSSRLLVAVILLVAVVCLSGCENRKILPEEYYHLKSAEERESDERQAEADAAAALPKIPTIGEERTWTAADGGSTVEGAMIKLENGRVHIKLKKGGESAIPLARLSEADQQYANETAAKHGK
jgi:hypothetical protein